MTVHLPQKLLLAARRFAAVALLLCVSTSCATMHGKTKLVSIPFKVARGKNGAGMDVTTYKGKLTIDRQDFGIGTDSIAAKISLEDDVDIELLIVTFQK